MKRSDAGSALIVALVGVSIFSVMTGTLGFYALQQTALLKRDSQYLQTRADFAHATALAAKTISEDPAPHEDSTDDEWFGSYGSVEQVQNGWAIRVEDEESKLNLNHASRTAMEAFFEQYEKIIGPLRGDRKKVASLILKLRHENRINSLEELLLHDDFEIEDLAPLEPFLTVFPDNPLTNPNTAHPLILKTLVDSLSGDYSAKAMLWARLEEVCGDGGCRFSIDDLNPTSLCRKLRLPETPLVMQVVQDFASRLTLNSKTFRIFITSSNGATATGVFRLRFIQTGPYEVLYWHETI